MLDCLKNIAISDKLVAYCIAFLKIYSDIYLDYIYSFTCTSTYLPIDVGHV